jgi:acyl-CoA synthetase (AMP-forming)/AMP-acid ligase II
MNWDEFDRITENLALLYAQSLREELEDANRTQRQPTIGLIGGGNSIEYFCTQLALMKLGVRVLLLAESNPTNALHYLLDSCDVAVVITESKNANVGMQQIRKIRMVETLTRDAAASSAEVDSVRFQDFGDHWERHSFIIHSSGSTGLPKPIIHTNRSLMLIARMYRLFQDFEVKNWFLLFPL